MSRTVPPALSPPSTSAPAPELDVTSWLNVDSLSLAELRGKVVLIEAFQMLCPGCVSYGLPLAEAAYETFRSRGLVVVGLHTVFEHHDVVGESALRAFVAEYRLDMPIGIDRHESGRAQPVTFTRYGMRGTPTTLLIDRSGGLRVHAFGAVDHLLFGAWLGELLAEPSPRGEEHARAVRPGQPTASTCSVDGPCG